MKKSFPLFVRVLLILALLSLTACASTVTTINQWATSGTASSEFDATSWSAQQATGAPDTATCGDQTTAWASHGTDAIETLSLSYSTQVYATQAVIYISYHPTYVTMVELQDSNGTYHSVYTASPQTMMTCPYQLTINIPKTSYLVKGLRITIDQTTLNDWSEIDAVQLVGTNK